MFFIAFLKHFYTTNTVTKRTLKFFFHLITSCRKTLHSFLLLPSRSSFYCCSEIPWENHVMWMPFILSFLGTSAFLTVSACTNANNPFIKSFFLIFLSVFEDDELDTLVCLSVSLLSPYSSFWEYSRMYSICLWNLNWCFISLMVS